MNEFVRIVSGDDPVTSAEALNAFELLSAVVAEAPEPAEAVEASSRTIARMARDDLAAIVLDWWLVVTAGSAPPLGHAFNLPDTVPQPLRDAMAGITSLSHQGLPVPPAAWVAAGRRLRRLLNDLDEHLSLDSYGRSRLPAERDVWAYLQSELQPVVSALHEDRRAERFEFDERSYEKEMKREGIDENSRRWNEMLKRANECVLRVNEVVKVQQLVEPWVDRETPDPVASVPEVVTEQLGLLAPVLLAAVLDTDGDGDEADLLAVETQGRAAERLDQAVVGLEDSELSWLATLIDGWAEATGIEVPAIQAVSDRRTSVLDRVTKLRVVDVDCDEVELLLLDHDVAGAEALVEQLENQRKQSRRGEVVASTISRFRSAASSGPLPAEWEERLDEAAHLLSSGQHAEAESLVQALDRELRTVRRADAIGELERVREDLGRFGAPASLMVELADYLEELSSRPDKPVDSSVVQRSLERLDSIAAQRRQEVEERIRLAHETLDLERDLIHPDAIDELELRLSEAESALDSRDVMSALSLADGLLADIDSQRVHRWSLAEGEEALAAHLVKFCTQQLHFDPDDVRRLLVAAKTKPFVILAGLTGSGKSTIARLFAAALGADTRNGRFRRIAVRPDWIDQSEVLGSVNPLSNRFEPGWLAEVARQCERNLDQLHVVLLDEMNLAPVEQYLAEYLSAIEEARSGSEITTIPLYSAGANPDNGHEWPPSLPFPPNLIVIGTVNVDETTRVLSERVLDRANVLQLSVAISDAHHRPSSRSVQPWSVPFREWDRICVREPDAGHHEFLVDVGEILQSVGIGVGQRAHVELERFVANSKGLLDPTLSLDVGVLQRVIPKIRGFKRDLEPGLVELEEALNGAGCARSALVVSRWLDDTTSDDEFIDGTDARIGLLR